MVYLVGCSSYSSSDEVVVTTGYRGPSGSAPDLWELFNYIGSAPYGGSQAQMEVDLMDLREEQCEQEQEKKLTKCRLDTLRAVAEKIENTCFPYLSIPEVSATIEVDVRMVQSEITVTTTNGEKLFNGCVMVQEKKLKQI